MKFQPGCYECAARRILRFAKMITDDNEEQKELIASMLQTFLDNRKNYTSPELSADFHRFFAARTGAEDLYVEEKKRSTELGLRLLPLLQEKVRKSSDPFLTAAVLAVSGNVIDYGMHPELELETAEKTILDSLNEPFDRYAIWNMEREMERAEKIVYLLDNCGEAVLDRLIIERFPGKITVAVRGNPIFNDVTRKEAVESGITAPFIDSGAGVPGVSRTKCSAEFIRELDEADLIIAKGQGNFESGSECRFKNIFFLLRVKCAVAAEVLKRPLNSLQILHNWHHES